jgi:hypothetical protein
VYETNVFGVVAVTNASVLWGYLWRADGSGELGVLPW